MSDEPTMEDVWKQREARLGSLSIAEMLREVDTGRELIRKREEHLFFDAVIHDIRSILDESKGTFEMANVRPEISGLPFIVFISEKGGARHDVRVKVSPGPKVRDFVATVSVRPDVELLAGELSNQDLALLRTWIELNRDVIVRYWDGEILYTDDALAQLRKLPSK